MSACALPMDWRFVRACAVVRSGADIPFGYYAEVFDLDEEEVVELFCDAAVHLGARLIVGPNPVLH